MLLRNWQRCILAGWKGPTEIAGLPELTSPFARVRAIQSAFCINCGSTMPRWACCRGWKGSKIPASNTHRLIRKSRFYPCTAHDCQGSHDGCRPISMRVNWTFWQRWRRFNDCEGFTTPDEKPRKVIIWHRRHGYQ